MCSGAFVGRCFEAEVVSMTMRGPVISENCHFSRKSAVYNIGVLTYFIDYFCCKKRSESFSFSL